jgi:hypothetical protein
MKMECSVSKDIIEKARIIEKYSQQLFTSEMENGEEMDKFLDRYNLSKLKHKVI